MRPRISRLFGSLVVFLVPALLVILLSLAYPALASASGRDAAGNGHVEHVKSAVHPVGPTYFSINVTGTHYVYVNNDAFPNSVSGFKATSTGLTPLPNSPYVTGGDGSGYGYGGNQLAVSPDHKCIFASDDSSDTFNSFSINADGSLTLVNHLTVDPTYPEGIAVSPKGGAVFLAIYNSYTSSYIDSFSIGSGCAIKKVQGTDIGNAIGDVAVSADGSELFASSYIGGFINAYTILSGNSFKLLKTNTAVTPAPDGLVTNSTVLYSGNAGGNAETAAYAFNKNGVLKATSGSPATDSQGVNSAQVWYDRADNQIINTEQQSNSFGLYDLASGSYTFVAHASGTGSTPTQMAQIGGILLVTNEDSGNLSAYKVSPGKLTFKTQVSLPVSGFPNGIVAF